MKTRANIAAAVTSLFAVVAVLGADSRVIEFDEDAPFTSIRTFAIDAGQVNTQKPELNNRLFVQQVDDVLRTMLSARGLKETSDRPRIRVSFSLGGLDTSRVVRHPGPRFGGVAMPGSGIQRIPMTEGTLVVDVVLDDGALVWRGIYRDEEQGAPSLARRLPGDAKKLLEEFPPAKRR